MLEVVIVGENPASHGGFSTVGRHVARSLHARGARVRYVARDPATAASPTEPYELLEARHDGSTGAAGLVRAVGRAVRARASHRPVPILSIGGLGEHAELLTAFAEHRPPGAGEMVAYLPVDAAPLPPRARPTLDRADLVVPYTRFGAQAVLRTDPRARVAHPIPHGVDTDSFAPLAREERGAVRRARFGLADDEPLVGFFGRNCGHKRPDMALRIFAAWVRGGVVRCVACSTLVERPTGPLGGAYGTPDHCPHCHASEPFEPQPARSDARLYLHTELLTPRQRRVSGGWDLQSIARRLGVADQVQFDPSLRFGCGVETTELARRMAACDVHVLPYECGGWELTVLETGACGVPNVITDAAGPPEYAAPFSILVPPMMRIDGPHGTRALIDIGRAVEALQRLFSDHRHRRRLAGRGVEVARSHRWDQIGDEWFDLLEAVQDRLLPSGADGGSGGRA